MLRFVFVHTLGTVLGAFRQHPDVCGRMRTYAEVCGHMAGMESLFGGLSMMGSMVGLPAALDSAPSRKYIFFVIFFIQCNKINI